MIVGPVKDLTRRVSLVFIFAIVCNLSGCTLGPNYTRPEIPLPAQFSEPAHEQESFADMKWWEIFNDPILQELIKIAFQENKDLNIALARIDEARAVLGFTRADQFPRLDGAGNAGRTNPSNENAIRAGRPVNDFGLFGDLSFEIDLWGRLRRATEAERAQLLSTEYTYKAVVLSLSSAVASAYFTLLDLDNRLLIAEETISNRRGATKVITQRFQGGTVPELDVNQAQIEEEEAVVTAAAIKRELRQTENALNVLLGRSGYAIPRGPKLTDEKPPEKLPTGFPAALLERRPDVISAEEAAHAQFARIGVAKAEQLPRLDLLGFIGWQSDDISNIVSSDAFTWSIGGNALGPIVDFGKSKSKVEIAEAQAQQAMSNFELTVINAVREVEDALVGVRTYREESESRGRQSAAAKNAARLSRARYDDGVSSYLEVLDAERSQFQAELGHSLAQQQYLNSVVQLYKALGGGWEKNSSFQAGS